MYFYEIIKLSDKKSVVREFLKMCTDSPDIKLTEKRVTKALNTICKMEPNICNDYIICIEKTEDLDDEDIYDHVYALDKNDNEKYGLEINPWMNTIGYLVDDDSLAAYGREMFVALVLWEMTWFGYDNETVQKKAESWGNQLK